MTTRTVSTVVVVTGAAPLDRRAVAAVPPRRAASIAADGGLDHARAAGLDPSVLVGDLDSISALGPGVGDRARGGRAPPDRQGGHRHRAGPRPRGRRCSPTRDPARRRPRRPPRPRHRRPRRARRGRRWRPSPRSRRGGATTSCTSSTAPDRPSSTCPPARRSRCWPCTGRARGVTRHRRPLAAARRPRSARSSASASATIAASTATVRSTRRPSCRRHRHRRRPRSQPREPLVAARRIVAADRPSPAARRACGDEPALAATALPRRIGAGPTLRRRRRCAGRSTLVVYDSFPDPDTPERRARPLHRRDRHRRRGRSSPATPARWSPRPC